MVEHGLDLAPFYDDYTEARDAPPYDPRLMLKLLIFGYSNGITSSRALERRCHHDVAFMFLTAQAAPDFVAISRFRKRHLTAFTALFTQALSLCAQAGLVSLGRVALDGSKIRASASRHRAMSSGWKPTSSSTRSTPRSDSSDRSTRPCPTAGVLSA